MRRDNDVSSGSAEPVPSPNPTGIDREAIAVIGFALKYPQDVTSEENLWKLLLERRSTMTEVPSNRWNVDGFYKPQSHHQPGTVRTHTCLPITR
jgi:acyl transferase domain-containing protein